MKSLNCSSRLCPANVDYYSFPLHLFFSLTIQLMATKNRLFQMLKSIIFTATQLFSIP